MARLAGLFAATPGAPLRSLLLWPTLLTLAVTLLRFPGELRGWSPEYFSRLPGGGLSPLGITWLAPLVGFYFGWRLERAGVRSPSPAVAFGVPAAALVFGPLVAALGGRLLKTSWTSNFTLWAVVSVGRGGRRLPRLAGPRPVPAGLRVRGPHSRRARHGRGHLEERSGPTTTLPPPGFPALPPLRRWLWTSVLPQTTIWVAWTMATGALGGALGWRAARRRPR